MIDFLDNFWSVYSNLVLSLGTNALLALSIYLTLSCGMLAMANAAFMGIGAYTSAILTMNYGWPFPAAIAAGMAAPAVVAFLIGTIELSGLLGQELNLHGAFWHLLGDFDINTAGFIIAGLFVVTWAVALVVWRVGRIEERWAGAPAAHPVP